MQPHAAATMPHAQVSEHPFVTELKNRLGDRDFELCFQNKTTLAVSGDRVTVGVGSPFLLSWFQRRFRRTLSEAALAALGPTARVGFQVDSSLSRENPKKTAGQPAAAKTDGDSLATSPAAPKARTPRRFADLADFIVGPSNELALTAARAVCRSPGATFNPLFLHGGVGTGKSHLLEGIYKSLKRQHPSLHVMFLTSEAFANYFTQACREHTLPSFRQRFRNVDVLLVDDLDFLEGKRGIQEEFLHTFNQLESHNRQIVLTADRHPRLLTRLRDDLSTRCLSGLPCRIEAPDCELRKRILQHRAARMQADFSPPALTYVAERFTHNVRELLGALNCLETYYHMTGKRVSGSAARRALADLERDCVRIVRMSDVENAVCRFFRVDSDELKSPRRNRTVSQPRMLAMFLIRKHTQAAYSEIGQYFGGRDHSTVMSAEKKIKTLIQQDAAIRIASQPWFIGDVLQSLEQQLYAS